MKIYEIRGFPQTHDLIENDASLWIKQLTGSKEAQMNSNLNIHISKRNALQ